MSSDWWNQSSSAAASSGGGGGHRVQSYITPSRPARQPRFADELDADDVKMADGIRFLPSFASSPAGKALGGSIGSGNSPLGAGGKVSPPGGRGARSPGTGRWGGVTGDSPRNGRNRANAAQDEDMPPTASLRDSADAPTPAVASISPPPQQLPTPPSLMPSATTTSLYVFGPPLSILSSLQPYLAQSGPVASYNPGPEGSNWYIVTYEDPIGASYALRRHGEIVSGRYMLGLKVVEGGGGGGGVARALTGSAIESEGAGAGGAVVPSGVGTPIRIKDGGIRKPTLQKKAEPGDGNWEEEGSGGVTGKIAEWLFGR